ncbi:carbamoyltransferase [Haliangium ochraceum]|uniref:Carbamoyltransferase n=1 Tax=Haliangium ochraceum (strain DSM 14365 / JCM 11303 / SMP-2) TaxID=502025 RepID=D0LNT7_HALO1|nr:carbamoyltransferase C-terminal domain-containing protein [Haliangium ochraceum]ACY18763.1 Carbamoyltransferase [Haliangium ochraceum DSM 14365]
MSKVLGIYGGHDCGACLLVDGSVRVMIEEERLNRFKHGRPATARGAHTPGLPLRVLPSLRVPWRSLTYCLRHAGISLDELDAVVISDPMLAELLPMLAPERIMVVAQHHLVHAHTAFWPSGFDEAAVLVLDGDGEAYINGYEAESGYVFTRDAHYEIFKNTYERDADGTHLGLGWMYANISALLGFSSPHSLLDEAGKTMGLAAYGGAEPWLQEPWIASHGYALDFSGFSAWVAKHGLQSEFALDGKSRLGKGEDGVSATAANLAWKVQHELEEALVHLARELRAATGLTKLCLAGGVALNSVANGLLSREKVFDEVFVQPAASDCGQALGLAYMGHVALCKREARPVQIPRAEHVYLGASYSRGHIAALLERSQLAHREYDDESALIAAAAEELAGGGIIGWFHGGSEVGPRALGHRSILAAPTGAQVKDMVNERVKFREGFRPFAPSVLAERAAEIFEVHGDCRFMLTVVRVREPWRERIPAVVHVDGSARLQIVAPEASPRFHALLSRYEEISNVPVLLNTSFNLRGMPIVESPLDALRCFLLTDMRALYLENVRLAAPDPQPWPIRLRPEVAIERHRGRETLLRSSDSGSLVFADPQGRLMAALDGFGAGHSVAQLAQGDSAWAAELTHVARRLLRSGFADARVGELTIGLPR